MVAFLGVFLGGAGLGTFLLARSHRPAHALVSTHTPLSNKDDVPDRNEDDEDRALAFRAPTGRAPGLSCDEAQRIVRDFRKEQLAYVAPPVAAHVFAVATSDWLDPHGLWSAAPDATPAAVLEHDAAQLILDLQGTGDCKAPRHIGQALHAWTAEVHKSFLAGRRSPSADDGNALARRAFAVAAPSDARGFARTLGSRYGAFDRDFGAPFAPFLETGEERLFPVQDTDAWGAIVLAAAVRAYVDVVDPHSAWAPYGEEASVYDVDLESDRPPRLWEHATRTAVGARLDDGTLPPLAVGDVLLDVNGMATAGLSVEQLDQLAFSAAEVQEGATVTVLRAGQHAPLQLNLTPPSPGPKTAGRPAAAPFDLPVDRVPYGAGDVAIIAAHDVYDDLGALVTGAIARERLHGDRPLVGIILDLRGNGGGSTEGAIDTLGIFLPGAKLFPMKRRDGTIETDRAPEPKEVDRWNGPVATLVDVGTASAAEMIAGALSAYRRGPVIGAPTYGKGCAQEYMEDVAHTGILRVTTLLYALPDGAAVQRVGLLPTYRFPFEPAEGKIDREATMKNAPPSWLGPDVRGADYAQTFPPVPWPAPGAAVGPCRDPNVCRAIELLGDDKKRVASSRQR